MAKYLKNSSGLVSFYDQSSKLAITRGAIVEVNEISLSNFTKARIRKGGLLWATEEEYLQYKSGTTVKKTDEMVLQDTVETDSSKEESVVSSFTEEVVEESTAESFTKKRAGRPKKSAI